MADNKATTYSHGCTVLSSGRTISSDGADGPPTCATRANASRALSCAIRLCHKCQAFMHNYPGIGQAFLCNLTPVHGVTALSIRPPVR